MIRKNIKEQKGVTLVSLVVAVTMILILTNVIIYNLRGNLPIQKLRGLQNDIMNLRDKVSSYYTEYGAIPIVKDIEYTNISKIEETGVISQAVDTGKFYVIQLSSLDNLTLTYGGDFEKISKNEAITAEEINDLEDLYIINEDSHNIFYVRGVTVDNQRFHTDYTQDNIDLAPVDLRYVDGVKIPEDFYYVDGNRDTGIIISDVKGDDIQNTKKGNQYVWVPVEDFDEFVRKDFGVQNIPDQDFINTEKTASKYYEKKGNGVSAEDEVEKMYRSVNQNKGFFISRFEAGITVDGQVVSKKEEDTYNAIAWGNVDETGGAVEAARSVYPENGDKELVSTLCYGVQWDAIMNWISKDKNLTEYLTNSNSIGNYSDESQPSRTGAEDKYQIKNIYDLAGNVGEWTMENYNQNNYVIRGGNFSTTEASYQTLASRMGGTLNYENKTVGFRIALYIKTSEI